MHILDNQHLHNKLGTYHLTAKGTTSWFGFANLIIQTAIKKGIIHHNSSKKIIPIQSTCFDSKANRPKNSHLDCQSLEEDFNFCRTTWQNQTDDVLDQIILDIK